MADNKKYYYLRLKDNFFDSDEIVLLESMQDGYIYSNILLKLYLRSLRDNGRLMFNGAIPYSPQMIATITRHQVGTVEKALKIFAEMGLIEILDSGAIYMLNIQNMIGKSSTEADRRREYYNRIEAEKNNLLPDCEKSREKSREESREKSREKSCEICAPEIEIEIEKEIEIEREIDTSARSRKNGSKPKADKTPVFITFPLNTGEEYPITEGSISKWEQLYPAVDIRQELRKMRGWLDSNPTKRKTRGGIARFVNSWLSREQDRGGSAPQQPKPAYQPQKEDNPFTRLREKYEREERMAAGIEEYLEVEEND